MKVIKRDGSSENWNPLKIASAIHRAVADNEPVQKAIEDAVFRIENSFSNRVDVETIQDIVEQELGYNGNVNTLRNYAHYRAERANVRSVNAILNDIYKKQDSTILNENANIDGDTNCAQRDFIASEICKQWALENYLPKDIANAHIRGDIYIHDLGFSPVLPLFLLRIMAVQALIVLMKFLPLTLKKAMKSIVMKFRKNTGTFAMLMLRKLP